MASSPSPPPPPTYPLHPQPPGTSDAHLATIFFLEGIGMAGGSPQADLFRTVYLIFFFLLLTFRLQFDYFFFFAILPVMLHVLLYLYLSKTLVDQLTVTGVWLSILMVVVAVGVFLCFEEGWSHDIFRHYWISGVGMGMWAWTIVFRYRLLVQEASRGGGFAHHVHLLQRRLQGLEEEHRRLTTQHLLLEAVEGFLVDYQQFWHEFQGQNGVGCLTRSLWPNSRFGCHTKPPPCRP